VLDGPLVRIVDNAGDEVFHWHHGGVVSFGGGVPAQSTVGNRLVAAADGTLVTPDHLCPDMLRHENLGGADGPRGRVVRAFFWLLRAWPVRS
jgi:hypothetical protein